MARASDDSVESTASSVTPISDAGPPPVTLMERQLRRYARDLSRVLAQERRAAAELRRAYVDTFQRLLSMVSCCDHETASHLERIGAYVEVMAIGMGLDAAEVERLSMASALHDIGKIGVPREILNKPGPLTTAERLVMERHAAVGAKILQGSPSPHVQLSCLIAGTHHENWDGTGYPNRLAGTEIPLAGRIVRLADQYDALRSARPYKRAYTHDEACAVILEGDGRTSPSHFDPQLLTIYRDLNREFERVCGEIGPS